MTLSTEQSLLALEIERSLAELPVYCYCLKVEGEFDENEALQVTRHGAKALSFANNSAVVTDFGSYELVALEPLHRLESSHIGKRFVASHTGNKTLLSVSAEDLTVIQRLLNQVLFLGARKLANNFSNQLAANWGSGSKVQLVDEQPSQRIQIRNDYLDAFQTLTLTPEVLPNGTALVSLHLKHQLLPNPNITMEWVIRNRPYWLSHIRRVRHVYVSRKTGSKVTAKFNGTADNESPNTLLKMGQGSKTLLEYHIEEGNISSEHVAHFAESNVVKVSYGKSPVFHLATLLQPIFDFETLRHIEPKLLENIAKRLKWPIGDRVRVSWSLIKSMDLPALNTRLISIKEPERFCQRIPLDLKLQFHNGQFGTTEKDLLTKKAFKPMSRPLIAMLGVGANMHDKELMLGKHFREIKQRCQKWGAEDQIRWFQASPAADDHDLDVRLHNKNLQPSLLIIGIDGSADKAAIRNIAYRYGHVTQFMRLDHPIKTYNDAYYNNLAAGVFSKGGGIICSLENMPGDADLFIGLDMGGVNVRVPGSAFLFNRNGSQLGWQLADAQPGERLQDKAMSMLLERSVRQFSHQHGGQKPKRIVLHRDGRFFESMDVIMQAEETFGIKIDVLEIIKSGAPHLLRKAVDSDNSKMYFNPEVGDAFELVGKDELILATYSGDELGKAWGTTVSVRPLRLRKRYGDTSLEVMAAQVLALSRIHGASLYRHPRLPVTTHHADRFATLRQNCDVDDLSKMDRMCPVYL